MKKQYAKGLIDFLTQMNDMIVMDIETAPLTHQFDELPERLQAQWERKAKRIAPEKTGEEVFFEKAGIFSEFARVVCISVGIYRFSKEGELTLRIKTFSNEDEKQLLMDFIQLLREKFKPENIRFVAHNGREFDIPFLARRMFINGLLPLPYPFELRFRKPWEVQHYDTLDLWKFGDVKNSITLELLATVLGVETSKDDIDGSQVADVYYNEKDLARIAHYCSKDVAVTAQVFLLLTGFPPLLPQNIFFA
jgi:predicted PolB exonuclease-like 3'-5' exonuclease